MKSFGEKEAWAYPGTAHIFWVGLPSIISGTGKATDFKFSRYIQISEGPSGQNPIKNFREK